MTLAQFKHIYGERPVANVYAPGVLLPGLNHDALWHPTRNTALFACRLGVQRADGWHRPVLRVRVKEWKL